MNASRLIRTTPAYLTVAVICVLLNNAILIGLDWAGVHYIISAFIAALIVIPASYALHISLTYRVDADAVSFWRYAALQSLNTPATIALLFLIHDLGGLQMIYAAPLLTIIMFLYNFLGGFWAISGRHAASRAITNTKTISKGNP